ncbi:DUF4834 family protein [Hymenobacter taeanensis]|uniref:DUF4834 family protein n=1 Tax=Hymenobacter taeanensis TaxID=2735321 RepID=A0A6M6BFW0_9BACT|nr:MULTISPECIES: DUF4834 family protein [Hymenobacter]QJX47107.1 DUF4834 family protein [Hymenobacter taeanensis]UOQ81021.1 DUF4834 family protein [Hymenobacter sp. 5414T-23]
MATFLFTLLVVFFIARFVLPVVLRIVVGNFIKKQARRYGQAAGGSPFGSPFEPAQPRSNGNASTGEVHVDYVPPRQKPQPPKDFKGGDYVDFEEVK